MTDAEHIHKRNVSYYDHIAGQYNHTLHKDRSNEIIREKVAKKFREYTGNGLVLDFGGGTGLDLDWLTEYNKVIFSEPSSGMREIAHRNHHQNASVIFLDAAKTDFRKWDHDPPFPEKVDAVLCNFAVLNSIPDIACLFSSLSLMMKPGADLLALILDNRPEKLIHQSRRKAIGSLIFHLPFKFYIYSGTHKHAVYIHTDRDIKKAAFQFFESRDKETWKEYNFCLIHLVKK
jgi:SAM-dependent methyltransferase